MHTQKPRRDYRGSAVALPTRCATERRIMKKIDRFTKKIFRALYVPAVISSLGWALSDVADAVVIGQRMGTVGLAAISLILPVYMVNCLFAHGLGIGGSALYARLLGEGKPREAVESYNRVLRATFAFGFGIAVLGNLFLTPLLAVLGTVPEDGELFVRTRDYLRILISAAPLFYFSNVLNYYLCADDNGKLASIGSVLSNLCDIGLNILFVLVLGWGTAGAALSTALGQAIAICFYLPGVFGKAHVLQIKWTKISFSETFGVLKNGLSESVSYLYQLIFILFSNNILLRIGSEETVAVFDMIQNASYLLLYLYEGTNRAMQPIVSTYCGERREEEAETAKWLSYYSGWGIGLLTSLFVFAFPGLICGLFGLTTPTVLIAGTKALRIFCLGTLFAGCSMMASAYFQAGGKEKESLLIVSLRGGLVLIPLTFAFSAAGEDLFFWVFPATEVLSVAVWALLILPKNRKKTDGFPKDRIYTNLLSSSDGDIRVLLQEAETFCEK
ncbi:MAG: polysaccharide biosynthesis C-terminal domain-containing protein, partial [Clostridia bacterium]|nr:polysaccharide biosynthesis C-terminal domain-containing protein [Clostridia bacterium]